MPPKLTTKPLNISVGRPMRYEKYKQKQTNHYRTLVHRNPIDLLQISYGGPETCRRLLENTG